MGLWWGLAGEGWCQEGSMQISLYWCHNKRDNQTAHKYMIPDTKPFSWLTEMNGCSFSFALGVFIGAVETLLEIQKHAKKVFHNMSPLRLYLNKSTTTMIRCIAGYRIMLLTISTMGLALSVWVDGALFPHHSKCDVGLLSELGCKIFLPPCWLPSEKRQWLISHVSEKT